MFQAMKVYSLPHVFELPVFEPAILGNLVIFCNDKSGSTAPSLNLVLA